LEGRPERGNTQCSTRTRVEERVREIIKITIKGLRGERKRSRERRNEKNACGKMGGNESALHLPEKVNSHEKVKGKS